MASRTVIIEKVFGSYAIHPATINGVMELYKNIRDSIPDDVRSIADAMLRGDAALPYSDPTTIVAAMCDILEKPTGFDSSALTFLKYGPKSRQLPDTRPRVHVTDKMKSDLHQWIKKAVVDVADDIKGSGGALATGKAFSLDLSDLLVSKQMHPEDSLPFLRNKKQKKISNEVRPWASHDTFNEALEVRTIEGRYWNQSIPEDRIVERILRFINRYSHQDATYEMATYERGDGLEEKHETPPENTVDTSPLEDILKKLPRLPQRQDATNDQLRDVMVVANRLGCYDAADVIRGLLERSTCPNP